MQYHTEVDRLSFDTGITLRQKAHSNTPSPDRHVSANGFQLAREIWSRV